MIHRARGQRLPSELPRSTHDAWSRGLAEGTPPPTPSSAVPAAIGRNRAIRWYEWRGSVHSDLSHISERPAIDPGRSTTERLRFEGQTRRVRVERQSPRAGQRAARDRDRGCRGAGRDELTGGEFNDWRGGEEIRYPEVAGRIERDGPGRGDRASSQDDGGNGSARRRELARRDWGQRPMCKGPAWGACI